MCHSCANSGKLRLVILGGVVSRFHENENKNSNFVLQGLK